MVLPPGNNPAVKFLQQTNETEPINLFRAWAHYLLDSAASWQLPVALNQILARHKLKLRVSPLEGKRGMLLLDKFIVVNGDDRETVRSFSQAHELMELLTRALRAEQLRRFAPAVRHRFDRDKEDWCEQGAAELLMPRPLFAPLVEQYGVSLTAARQLTAHCGTSLTATVRRMLDLDHAPRIFALLKEGHKKDEVVPSQVGQGVLWGKPEDWDPPAQLRVWRWWRSPQTSVRLFRNESIARTSQVYQLYQSGGTGQLYTGYDALELEKIQGTYYAEAMTVTIQQERVVMLMLHL